MRMNEEMKFIGKIVGAILFVLVLGLVFRNCYSVGLVGKGAL